MPYRIASSALGFWLMLSVFLWPHDPTRGFADFFVGSLLLLAGFCGIFLRLFRFFETLLGLWLVWSAFALSAMSLTGRLHDGLLGLVVVALSVVPGRLADERHDHWVAEFDQNPTLLRRSLLDQELNG